VQLQHVGLHRGDDLVEEVIRRVHGHRDRLCAAFGRATQLPGPFGRHIARALGEEDEPDMARAIVQRRSDGFRRGQAADLDVEGHGDLRSRCNKSVDDADRGTI
jgi:hypothetical protein